MWIKRNFPITYLFYCAIVSFYLVAIISNYNYFDIYLLFFILSFYYIGYVILKDTIYDSLITIRVVFNVFGFLYTNFYIIDCIEKGVPISENIYISMNLSYLAILCFNTSYSLVKQKGKGKVQITKIDLNTFNWGLFIFLIVSIGAYYYVTIYKIGLAVYFFASRAEKSLLTSDYSILQFYPYTLPLISTISLYLYLSYKNKVSYSIFIIALFLSLTNAVITGSRGEMLIIAFPIIYLLRLFNVISAKFTILICIGGFVLFGIWKSLYTDNIEVQYDSEFVSWYRICDTILSDSSGFEYLFGKSYFQTLINLVIPVTNMESLSTWYVRKYENAVFLAGGGRGFPSVFEAYMNFHVLGVVLVYSFYGCLAKKINRSSELGLLIYIIVLISLYKLFRSPAYSFWKNMMWFEIYPTLFIYKFSQIKSGRRLRKIQK